MSDDIPFRSEEVLHIDSQGQSRGDGLDIVIGSHLAWPGLRIVCKVDPGLNGRQLSLCPYDGIMTHLCHVALWRTGIGNRNVNNIVRLDVA